MQISLEYLQTLTAYAAEEGAKGKAETGTTQVAVASDKRKQLEATVKTKQEELQGLNDEMERINNEDDALRVFLSLFGDDMGAGRVADDMGRVSAEMKLAQEQILVQATAIEMALKKLQTSQSDLGQRFQDRAKLNEEIDAALLALER